MKNDIAQLKRETAKQEQTLAEKQKQQARQATRLAIVENLHNVFSDVPKNFEVIKQPKTSLLQ